MFENLRVVKSIAIAVISVALFVINLIIMKNPVTRRHSGLTEDDMTTEDYFHELDPEKARRIEMHNGGVPQENLTDENETAHEKAPTETEDSVR